MLAGKSKVLPDLCAMRALHEFQVYLTEVGMLSDRILKGSLSLKKKEEGGRVDNFRKPH